VPVRPLEYTTSSGNFRSGLLISIGTVSIIIAAASVLYSLLLGLQGLEHYRIVAASIRLTPAQRGVAVPTASPPVTGPAGPAPADPSAGGPAMRPAEREALIDAMTKRKPLSPLRHRQLDALLAVAGTRLGADSVKWRDTVPASDSADADGDEFITSRGRVWVYDDRAVFAPTYGWEKVRVFAPVESSDAGGGGARAATGAAATSPAVGPGGLSQSETQAVIQEVDAKAKASNPNRFGLTPKQVASLQSLLAAQAPGQELVLPGAARGAVRIGYSDFGGRVRIEFSNSSTLVLDEKGTVTSRTGPAPFVPPFSTSLPTIAASVAMAFLSLGLAALLLVAGILMVRCSPGARRLHLVYAWLKIPVAMAAGLCIARVTYGITNDFAAGAGVPFDVRYPAGITWGDALAKAERMAALSCIYPIALLIALNTNAVRKYFRPVAAGA
jgi:hypothetical protein